MANGVSLGQPQVFQCPNCREFINTTMTHCSYCGVSVDANAAHTAAQNQQVVASACHDANYAKILARAFAAFYFISWIPVLGGFASLGWVALLFIVPILLVRWWVKYSKLQTADADYEKAKRETIIAAIIWAAVMVVWFILSVLLQIVLLFMER